MTIVRREQFRIVNDARVVHGPTGATFSRYRGAPTPVNDVAINWNDAGEQLDNGELYERAEIGAVAQALLRELARHAAR